MKNNGIKIVLFIAVILIWGLLIYKIYYTVYGSHKINNAVIIPNPEKPLIIIDTYSVHTYKRDPFLSILTDTISQQPTVEIKPFKIFVKKSTTLPLYCGVIRNGKKKTAILKMNKKIFFLHEGDTLQSMKIKTIMNDSIVVMNGEDKISIFLNKEKSGKYVK